MQRLFRINTRFKYIYTCILGQVEEFTNDEIEIYYHSFQYLTSDWSYGFNLYYYKSKQFKFPPFYFRIYRVVVIYPKAMTEKKIPSSNPEWKFRIEQQTARKF